ncbi:MAG: peptidoglycan bridge formation glycyltransferase FemA/FemB family protein [bacterium]|nr:peptidoglycan bridge formation glycyltransferase FemA/FemB family protein [bacterium]
MLNSEIKIKPITDDEKEIWNSFVIKNYPPIGSFMLSWEWGSFQTALGRKTERFKITSGENIVGFFTLIYCNLPLKQSYGYIPRGPALDLNFFNTNEKIGDLFKSLQVWVKENFPQFIFVRFEPPIKERFKIKGLAVSFPEYYIQPRRNLAINLNKTEEEILTEFHPSNRANVRKAERKNVTVETKESLNTEELNQFFNLAKDTSYRNNSKHIFPDMSYFETIQKIALSVKKAKKNDLSICFFVGKHEGRVGAINMVLFFGGTATYLFGASATLELPSKITTYLHWYGIKESKKMGFKYYDLGGIDEKLWASLTTFKRRFKGEEFEYIGNVDIIIKPLFYKLFNLARKIKKSI